jgi:hypothetical protein
MRFAIAVAIACYLSAAAARSLNGFAEISRDRLVVELSGDEAVFNGTFLFRSNGVQFLSAPLEIPVWFPDDAPEDLALTNVWWSLHSTNGLRGLQAADALNRINMKVDIGTRRRPVSLAFYGYDSFPELGPEPGYCRLWCGSLLQGDEIRKSTPVVITYRQPLLRSGGKGHFFYVPVLSARGEPPNTLAHSLTLRVATNCSVLVTNGQDWFRVAPGRSSTLTLLHLRPIRCTVTKIANPQGGANGEQPFGSEANRVSSAAGSHR